MFRLPWLLGDAGLVKHLNGGRRSEMVPVLQHQDYLLVRRSLDKLSAAETHKIVDVVDADMDRICSQGKSR